MSYLFRNNMVWLDNNYKGYSNINVGNYRINNCYEYYSSNDYNIPIIDKNKLRNDNRGRFKYATDYPLINDQENYKVVYFDLENLNGVRDEDIHKRRITAVSMVIDGKSMVIDVTPENELNVLSSVVKTINKRDIIVAGWNLEYDFKLLTGRIFHYTQNEVNFECVWIDLMSLYSKFVLGKANKVFISLNQALINTGLPTKVEFTGSLDNLYKTNKKKYFEYAEYDTVSLSMMEDKLKLISLSKEICNITGSTIHQVLTPMRLGEDLIYKFLKERGKIFWNKPTVKENFNFTGAVVFEPVVGLHRDCVINDFMSLYPITIIMYNISPDTKITELEARTIPHIKTPNGVYFRTDRRGILPEICLYLLDQRAIYRKTNYLRQWAYKILANSMYGIFGNAYFRLADKDIAESITLSARHLTQHTYNELTKKLEGSKKSFVIYGDTDSIMVKNDKKIDDYINEYIIDRYIKEKGLMTDTPYKFKIEDEYGLCDIMMFSAKKTYAIKLDNGRIIYKNIDKSNRAGKAIEFFRQTAEKIFNKEVETVEDLEIEREKFFARFNLSPEWLTPYSIKKPREEYKSIQPWMRGLDEFKKHYPDYNKDIREGYLLKVLGDYRVGKRGQRLKTREEFYLACPKDIDMQELLDKTTYEIDYKYYKDSIFILSKYFEEVL